MELQLNKIKWKQVIVFLIVIAIGLVIINQYLDFKYKVEFLQTACEVCESYGNICQAGERIPRLDLQNIYKH